MAETNHKENKVLKWIFISVGIFVVICLVLIVAASLPYLTLLKK
jgi:hypothetical protein